MTTKASPGESKNIKKKKEVFSQQYNMFWGGIGSIVEFKQKSRGSVKWEVEEIETDWQACHWTKGGTKPMFIHLKRETRIAGGKTRTERCVTFTDALKVPNTKGRWQ